MKFKNQKIEAKGCPKCHKLMKSAVIKGKNVWICLFCGTKTEAAQQALKELEVSE